MDDRARTVPEHQVYGANLKSSHAVGLVVDALRQAYE
jgi:hypothetical protein